MCMIIDLFVGEVKGDLRKYEIPLKTSSRFEWPVRYLKLKAKGGCEFHLSKFLAISSSEHNSCSFQNGSYTIYIRGK